MSRTRYPERVEQALLLCRLPRSTTRLHLVVVIDSQLVFRQHADDTVWLLDRESDAALVFNRRVKQAA